MGEVVINLMREKKELWDLRSLKPACALPTPLKPVLSAENWERPIDKEAC